MEGALLHLGGGILAAPEQQQGEELRQYAQQPGGRRPGPPRFRPVAPGVPSESNRGSYHLSSPFLMARPPWSVPGLMSRPPRAAPGLRARHPWAAPGLRARHPWAAPGDCGLPPWAAPGDYGTPPVGGSWGLMGYFTRRSSGTFPASAMRANTGTRERAIRALAGSSGSTA